MRRAAVALATVAALVAGCGGDPDEPAAPAPTTSAPSSPTASPTAVDPVDPVDAFDVALSEPAQDSIYPDVGDPGVDALHYDLDLAWDPTTDTLTGDETLTFRSATDADAFRLDFSQALEVSAVTVDGAEVAYSQADDDLVVTHPVATDERYAVRVRYAGIPEPVPAPTTRDDFDGLGLTIDDRHQVWTMQEPYGAFTWYAVNDQPADKALYDFTLRVPAPWTGIANGEQVADRTVGGVHATSYHLAEPAASYLVTLAFGDYDRTDDTGPGGLPITYWTFAGDEPSPGLRSSPDALAWLEDRLGPYPFDTAGILLVDSESGMETQTMITLGDTDDATRPEVVVHEFAHHWWGDQVTPDDWRDVWMNEGMAMYLQLLWEAEQQGIPDDAYLADLVDTEAQYRAESGPPGAYDPDEFARPNVYFSGAFLWHAVRDRVGDDAFWSAVRGWPLSQDNRSSDRETLLAYLESETGTDLDDLWDAWLLDDTSPDLP